MGKEYYVASCVFTSRFPQLSDKIQRYLRERYDMPIVRCCIPKYKLKEYEEKMPEQYRSGWRSLPDCATFGAGDVVYSVCHNCSNIIEETRSGVKTVSLWELILLDDSFVYPDFSNMKVTVQDCWRSKERHSEQLAVRSLLKKMGIDFVELNENMNRTEFCGNSLYKPQPARNPKLAPLHYEVNAQGKFLPHTIEEQEKIMKEYCKQFSTDDVICYCHYCLEGLLMGGVNGKHIAELLFDEK